MSEQSRHTSDDLRPRFFTRTARAWMVALAMLCASTAEALTYYVSQSGSDTNSCAAASSPTQSSQKATIAAGVACLAAGDTLLIHGGTYTGSNNVIDSQAFRVPSGTSWSNPVTIAGIPGETVTLRPPHNVSGIRLTTGSPSYVIVQDLIIDMSNSGAGADAAGISLYRAHHNRFQRVEVSKARTFGVLYSTETPFNEMINCRIHDNGFAGATGTNGHGLYITGSDNLFEDNEVYDNYGYGFHIYNNAGPRTDPSRNIVRRNKIYRNGRNNQAAYGLVVAWGSDNVAYNNLIYANWGGVEIYTASSNAQIFNNTIYNNSPGEGIALQSYAGAPVVRNNIIYGNRVDIVDYGGGATPVLDHNLTVVPGFTNAGASDFTLQAGSAARNAGVSIGRVTDDFARTPRPQDGVYDIGAFEFASSGSPAAPAAPQGIRLVAESR